MPKPGKLVFKGDSDAPKKAGKKKGKKKKKRERAEREAGEEASGGSGSGAAGAPGARAAVDDTIYEPVRGTGRITSSGTAVQGHGTKFMSELNNGDAILVTHPSTLVTETRLVKMVLGNVSIGISSAFSSDLISTTSFKYVKAPREEETEEMQKTKKKKAKLDEEKTAFGTYDSQGGKEFVYRVKKAGVYGGYEIIKASADAGLSREQLLEMRCKKKADRNCY